MQSEFAPRPQPLSALYGTAGLIGLALVYLLVGLVGHDPWRGDDSVYFAPVHAMLHGEGWLLPQIAGEPFVDWPPLYYWLAAMCAHFTAWVLPEHDGARLASALCVGISLLALSRAALAWWGRETLGPAGLLMLGCLGLVIHAHETQPMLALLAAQSIAFYGCAKLAQQAWKGGAWLGLGLATAFLAGGLDGLVLTLPLLVALFLAPGRDAGGLVRGGVVALLFGVALGGVWPLALHWYDPAGFALWWGQELADLGLNDDWSGVAHDLVRNLGWFAWPLWPLAAWHLWRARQQWRKPGYVLPLVGLLPALIFPLLGDNGLRPQEMLPVLPPLAILAAAGSTSLRRGAANAFDWFALMTFTVFGVLVWLAWTAMLFGWPPGLGRQLAKQAPHFQPGNTLVALAFGLAICAGWVSLLMRLPRSAVRPSFNWALGMTMLWCLAAALLMQWFQHGKTYRPAADALATALADRRGACVAMDGVTLSQRASFDYFAGLRFLPAAGTGAQCPLRLVFRDRQAHIDAPQGWQEVWHYRRGGGKQLESFALLRREPAAD